MTHSEVMALLELTITQHGSALVLARRWRLSPQYLSDVRRGRRAVSARLAVCLGLRRVVGYEPRR